MDLTQLRRVASFLGLSSKPKEAKPVRIGLLGASQVGTYALIWPAKRVPLAEVVAVAARDGKRAHEYARQHGIQKYYGSYDQLLSDPEIDAVYVGLPNGLHGHWTRKAMQAGKHVLCEKPFASNSHEVREVQALARSKGLLCREAFHYREHPLATRLRELVLGDTASDPSLPAWLQPPTVPGGRAASGVLGQLRAIDVKLLIPHWVFGGANIRFSENLAGGAMMDAGCYCASMLRLLSGAEPRVTSARADLWPGSQTLDGAMRATVEWPSLPGVKGSLHASLQHKGLLPITEVLVTGERGTLHCSGFVMPHFGHSITLRRSAPAPITATTSATLTPSSQTTTPGVPLLLAWQQAGAAAMALSPNPLTKAFSGAGTAGSAAAGGVVGEAVEEWQEHAYGGEHETTYVHQLQRFVTDLDVMRGGASGSDSTRSLSAVKASCAGDQSDAYANQSLVDSVYLEAGLPLRSPTAMQQATIKNRRRP